MLGCATVFCVNSEQQTYDSCILIMFKFDFHLLPQLYTHPPAVTLMDCSEMSAREEFTYSHMPMLERNGGTLGRRGERAYRPERDSYTVDVRASDLQLDQPEPLKHPCFSCRAWLYSVLIGVSQRTALAGFTCSACLSPSTCVHRAACSLLLVSLCIWEMFFLLLWTTYAVPQVR